ncbi:Aldehyde dehydrogenase, conserved site-containing protein [Artemisia annua]|uniref:aldehyde dehydrogenase (NAD(+)) n=1 Tax=Artemisia annua TaxID=35608 RepID=A0A2U1LT44_ARTAN|nr:Aldehyde dehydrogenase, conserved site-containing protein [Artemisia annua]
MASEIQVKKSTLFDTSSAETLVKDMRGAVASGKTKSYEWRLGQLKSLLKMVESSEKLICDALFSDLGKPQHEAFIHEMLFMIRRTIENFEINGGAYFRKQNTQIAMIKSSCKSAMKNLKGWMKPEKAKTNIGTFPSSAEIISEPLGVVLVISAWNYPLLLSVDPVIGAIAAGNAVVLKPSEISPAMSSLLAKLFAEYLDNSAIKVVEGNGRVARVIMAAAAKHLTPVVLELGGKCPVLVDSEIDLTVTARRIVSGKWGTNNGQACVAPDYIITTKSYAPVLIDAMKHQLVKFFGEDPINSPDISRIVNSNHFTRLTNLLDDDKVSAKIIHGGQTDKSSLKIAPTIVLDAPEDSLIMNEEIFGPILPIVTVEKVEDGIDFINSRSKPLAAYVFTNKKKLKEEFVTARRIVSGKWGTNNGQACVAPDYIITTKSYAPVLIDAMKHQLVKFFGEDPINSPDISRIVNSNHFTRLTNLLDDDKVSAKIIHGGQTDKSSLKIAPTIVLDAPEDSLIMNEEIFGPILPIVTVEKVEDGIDFINSRSKPLAAYVFTNKKKLKEEFLMVDTLPFGGIGESGTGAYHGKFSFDAFSHKKAVLYRSFMGDAPASYKQKVHECFNLLQVSRKMFLFETEDLNEISMNFPGVIMSSIIKHDSCPSREEFDGWSFSLRLVSEKHVRPLPLTKEAIMSLNNYSVFCEHARSLFHVDLPTFKAKLLELDIFVWKEPNGLRVRIHGGDYKIVVFIRNIHRSFDVRGTLAFFDLISQIERAYSLPLEGYKLTYEQPQTVYNLLKTDRDWHYAVEYSKVRDASDKDDDKDASASRVAMLNLVLDVVPFVHDSCLLTLLVSVFLVFGLLELTVLLLFQKNRSDYCFGCPRRLLIMNQELFGPILPIVMVEKVKDGIDFINSRSKPLAAYVFTNKKELKEEFVSTISAGGAVINDVTLHLTVDTLPFGGIGESGTGAYYGKFSFDAFSHKKAVLYRTCKTRL